MSITAATIALLPKLAGIIAVGKVLGKVIDTLTETIIPLKRSKAYKLSKYNLDRQAEMEKIREEFQRSLQKESMEHAEYLQLIQRHTSMLVAEQNHRSALKNIFIQDSLRRFPLKVSPYILMENNNIDTVATLCGSSGDAENLRSNVLSLSMPRPLSVFIVPVHIDSRLVGNEVLATQVGDNIYSNLESFITNEYGSDSPRPIKLYSTAWNSDVKGGLHSADEIYFYLKNLPSIVIEPKYDGTTFKLTLSYWSIGYEDSKQHRTEISIPLDVNVMVVQSAYNRSKKAMDVLSGVSVASKAIQEQKASCACNVRIYEELHLSEHLENRMRELIETGHSDELKELGDYIRFFTLLPSDISVVSDSMTVLIAMIVSALADVHHLLSNDVSPHFPSIYRHYYSDHVDTKLLRHFSHMYEMAYIRLSETYPEQENVRLVQKENVMALLGFSQTEDLRYALVEKCKCLKAGNECDRWSDKDLIDYYIDHLDDDVAFRKAIRPWFSHEQEIRLNNMILTKQM